MYNFNVKIFFCWLNDTALREKRMVKAGEAQSQRNRLGPLSSIRNNCFRNISRRECTHLATLWAIVLQHLLILEQVKPENSVAATWMLLIMCRISHGQSSVLDKIQLQTLWLSYPLSWALLYFFWFPIQYPEPLAQLIQILRAAALSNKYLMWLHSQDSNTRPLVKGKGAHATSSQPLWVTLLYYLLSIRGYWVERNFRSVFYIDILRTLSHGLLSKMCFYLFILFLKNKKKMIFSDEIFWKKVTYNSQKGKKKKKKKQITNDIM